LRYPALPAVSRPPPPDPRHALPSSPTRRSSDLIPDGQHLIHQEDRRIQVGGHSKSQADIHSAGISFYGRIDKALHAGKCHDLVESGGNLPFFHSQNIPIQENILASGQLFVKPSSHFQ